MLCSVVVCLVGAIGRDHLEHFSFGGSLRFCQSSDRRSFASDRKIDGCVSRGRCHKAWHGGSAVCRRAARVAAAQAGAPLRARSPGRLRRPRHIIGGTGRRHWQSATDGVDADQQSSQSSAGRAANARSELVRVALSRGQPAGAGQNLCSLAWRCRARPRHRRWCERRAVARAPCPKAPCSSGSGGRCEGGIGGAAPSRPGAADPRPGLSRGGGPHPPPPGAPGGEERRHSGGPGSAEPRLTHRGDGSLLPPHHPQREGRSARHAQVSRRPSPSAPHLGLHAGYRGRPPHTAALRRAARNLRASSVGAETLCLSVQAVAALPRCWRERLRSPRVRRNGQACARRILMGEASRAQCMRCRAQAPSSCTPAQRFLVAQAWLQP